MKKLFAVLIVVALVLVMPLTALAEEVDTAAVETQAPVIEYHLKGDVNDNGEVSASDARAILRMVAGLDKMLYASMLVCDMNNDGRLSAADARLALRVAAGLGTPTYYPITISPLY